jgi:hypothetical protein
MIVLTRLHSRVHVALPADNPKKPLHNRKWNCILSGTMVECFINGHLHVGHFGPPDLAVRCTQNPPTGRNEVNNAAISNTR